ncbi:MAG TPA: LLM class flavin-dependent oxidoreductase [Pseudonocardia sp.]
MGSTTVVEVARRALGPVGAFLPVSGGSAPSIDTQRAAARRLEHAGYPAAWTNEVIGKDALVQLALLLEATDRMAFGTGIANIWARSPQTAHGAAALLAQAYPDRFVLGLGVGYVQQAQSVGREFGKPLATMREYVNRMSEPPQMPAPDVAYPLIIGAMGPKMLALAAEIADGAMPAMVSPEFTATARQVLGPDKLLVVLIDGSVEQGDAAAIAATANAHAAAGADHVIVGLGMGGDYAEGVDRLEQLAPELLKG